MDLLFLGPPGAGKGTQARRVAAALGVTHLSTGDLLRDAVRNGTGLGRQAKPYLDRGELVPDELVDRLVSERLATAAAGEGFLFDGYPRNLAQAEALARTQERVGRKLDAVVVMAVEDRVIEARLAGRRSCPSCKAMYHLVASPPRQEGKCDACGADLVVRSDDRPEVVRDRLEIYHRETSPLLEHYGKQGLVREIDAAQDIVAVTGAVLRLLGRG